MKIYMMLWMAVSSLAYIDNYVYVRRLCKMGINKSTKNISFCAYCKGYGYLHCQYCIKGCWRCSNSGLLPCKFCLGDGKHRYVYVKQK